MIGTPSYKAAGCGCGGTLSAAPCGCGGAQCDSCQGHGIARPSFFAGQLLTEDDLQLLADYVGHKNRLHNRHLFGAGVVCGLEVTCHPCGEGRVIVHPGYALDCCGNDLTLACAQTLDINAMIRDLRRDQLGGFDCGDPCADPDTRAGLVSTDAAEAPEQGAAAGAKKELRYCLYVRYCEQASDPVMPYSTGEDCGRAECVPTRVREGVKFELRCRPRGDAANPMLGRLCACLGDLNRLPAVFDALKRLQSVRRLVTKEQEPQRLSEGYRDYLAQTGAVAADYTSAFQLVREWLIERLGNAPFITDCTLRRKVYALEPPAPGGRQGEYETQTFTVSVQTLTEYFVSFVRDCVCRALNPACLPCDETGVLLACLDVADCEVVKVCNMERTFVMSPAAVRYWLPPLQLLGNLLERLCCDPLEALLTDRTDDTLDFDIGRLDILPLLKGEIMRILEDSLCLTRKGQPGHLRTYLDDAFAARKDRAAAAAAAPTVEKARETADAATKERATVEETRVAESPAIAKASVKAPTSTKTTTRKTRARTAAAPPAEPQPTAAPKNGATLTNSAEVAAAPKGDEK